MKVEEDHNIIQMNNNNNSNNNDEKDMEQIEISDAIDQNKHGGYISSDEENRTEEETNNTNNENKDENDDAYAPKSCIRTFLSRLLTFYCAYDFPIHILIGIGLAKAYPELGAVYLRPKITASWIATGLIFFVSGLGLKTHELVKVVFRRFFFNLFVEGFNFGVVSLIVFGISRALGESGILPQPLADGLAITACLPMSINAVIILTTAAHGDEAASIFHATFGNVCGIFLSPILIVLYLPSVTADVDLPKVFLDLTLKVIVPLVCGQIVHIIWEQARLFYFAHKKFFKKLQETSLVYIVYTVFCRNFSNEDAVKISFGRIAILILFIFMIMVSCMILAWYCMKYLFPNEPLLRVMGIYGCTQKTIALGIPLILSIFGGTPYESLYTLPILIWHPMQLVVGSIPVSRLQKFVASEKERLGIVDEVDHRYSPKKNSRADAVPESATESGDKQQEKQQSDDHATIDDRV